MEETFWSHVRRLSDASPRLLGAPGDDCIREIFAESTFRERLTIRFRTGMSPRERYDQEVTSGAAVRQIGRVSVRWSCVDSLDPEDVARELGESPGSAAGRRSSDAFPEHIELPDDAPTTASIEEKRYLLQAAADAAFSLEPALSDLEVTFQGRVRRTAVWASDSPPAFSAGAGVAIRIAARLDEATVHAVGGGSGGLGTFLLAPPEELARECVDRLRRIRSARPLRAVSHELPVVLEAGWGGAWLHEAIGHLLEAGTPGGYRAEAIGSRIAPEGVTLVDDGTLEHGRASARYDDEGQPSNRNILIRDGRLERLMTDRITARRTGLPRTGNGRRQGYRFQPMPRMTNLMLEGGSTPAADLVADVDHGLYARTIAGGHVDPGSDTFTLDVLDGAMIENGRLTAPIAGLRLSGRPSDILWRIAGIGDDFRMDPARGTCAKGGQVVPVSVGMPTILLSRMSVSAMT